MYRDVWAQAPAKAFQALDANMQRRVTKAVEEIRADPIRAAGVKPLTGQAGTYRKRIGSYRLLYTFDSTTNELFVQSLRKREDAYR